LSSNYRKGLIVVDSITKKNKYGEIQLDPKVAFQLNLKIGDIIEIKNEKTGYITVGKLIKSDPLDVGTGFIYLSWFLRRNLLVNINDSVSIRKIIPKGAKEIEFMGFDKPIRMKNINNLKYKLPTIILSIGDILSFDLKGHLISLAVRRFSPNTTAVVVRKNTRIICNN